MKKTIHFLLFSLIITPSILLSQISISQTDFVNFSSIGQTHTSFADTLTESIDIGNVGGGNNWDFSNLLPHNSFEVSYISPVGTPFADTFATANTVGFSTFSFEEGNVTGTGESYTYYSTNDASTIGSGMINSVTDMSGTTTSTNIIKHYPPFSQYDFPIEANKTWSVTDSSETLIISDEGTFSTVQKTVYNIHIDAWGSMTLPSGKTVDALRSREQSLNTSYIFGIPIGNTISVHYFFMTKSGESLSILAESEDPPTSGVITGSVGWSDDDVTDVERFETLPNQFALMQNYPNPFNPSTTIEYRISEPSFVNLRIYDALGNEVKKLVSEQQPIGNYKYILNAAKLSSGIYIVQLNAGKFNQTRRMVLLK